MPREGGASSTPRRSWSSRPSPAYWIARLRGRWQRP